MPDSKTYRSTPDSTDTSAEPAPTASGDELPTLPSDVAELLHALKTAGHEQLSCEYSGEGDEGCIREIVLDSETLGSEVHGPDRTGRRLLPNGAADFANLEGWLAETIYAGHDGYQDNEGGGGKIVIDLCTGHLTHERYVYTVQAEALDSLEHDLLDHDAAAGSQPKDATTSSPTEDE